MTPLNETGNTRGRIGWDEFGERRKEFIFGHNTRRCPVNNKYIMGIASVGRVSVGVESTLM